MNINTLKEYHLKLYERMRLLHDELYSNDILSEHGINIKVNALDSLQKVIAGYDEMTDTEQIITSKINELESYYIYMDLSKTSQIIDRNVRNIIEKHGFKYGPIIFDKEKMMLLISLDDTMRPK